MGKLCATENLSTEQRDILATVRDFVDQQILPMATHLEHADEYPTEIVAQMKQMGLFGLTIDEEYGGLGESLLTYALVVEEIARGWMSVSGIINTHFIVAYLLQQHGTPEQRAKYLPRLAAGDLTCAFSMSEPGLGSDVAAVTTSATPDGRGRYTVNGQKMWVTNGASSSLVAVLVRTPEGRDRPHQNLTTFLIEKTPGFGEAAPGLTIPGKIEKMGYKGVDTTELLFDDYSIDAAEILGGEPGRGFYQMMDGVEVGRVNVAARAVGVAHRAFELGTSYAQQRETFGKPIAEHQAVLFRIAEMGTKVEAAHQMVVRAARVKDAGERNDLEAGMAKYLASEYCRDVVEDAFTDPRRIRFRQGVRDRTPLPRGPHAPDRRGNRRHPADDHRPAAAGELLRTVTGSGTRGRRTRHTAVIRPAVVSVRQASPSCPRSARLS
ncbi:acyl-CoA dehydrogenase family protein [Gordonia cholesterolivorans]|uniref:Acyl-CoA dehydrogenase family protein n=1 Tax=Gordonia cholesterolivorans TaxID=559625 RepID=A0ABP5U5U8_9ACTN